MQDDIFDLTGRVAVVTGAARGLGKAAALGLGTFGADVAAIDLSAENCSETLKEIESFGRTCRAFPRWRFCSSPPTRASIFSTAGSTSCRR